MIIKHWLAISAITLVFWPFATGDAVVLGPITQLEAPCNTTPNDVTGKGSYLRVCKDVQKDSIDMMKKQVRLLADKMYQEGKSMDPSVGVEISEMAPGASNADSMHQKFAKPVCTLIPGPLNDFKDETDTNHFGESCGPAAQIAANTHPGGASVRFDMSGNNGLREMGYYGGAFVQAMTCFQAQVEKEVSTGKLNVSNDCNKVAAAIRDKGNEGTKLVDKLKNELGATKNMADLRDCKTNEWDISGKDTNLDVGQLRQSRQQLCASRESIEKMYAELMVCEVFHRAGVDFENEFVSTQTFFENIKKGPGEQCSNQCAPQCATPGQCIKVSGFIKKKATFQKGQCDTCSNSCGNTCYQRALPNYIRNRIQKWDPNNPTSRCNQAV